MRNAQRSPCPINLSLELFGDRWSLLIVRDIMFCGKRHFREMLQSEEGISTNILADRLKKLVDQGIITRHDDPTHLQKGIFSLTEKGIELLPILVRIGAWGCRHLPSSDEPEGCMQELMGGGPATWDAFMAALREDHLGAPADGPPGHDHTSTSGRQRPVEVS